MSSTNNLFITKSISCSKLSRNEFFFYSGSQFIKLFSPQKGKWSEYDRLHARSANQYAAFYAEIS